MIKFSSALRGLDFSPFSCRFLCRHQADHYRASSWDHNVISSAICSDSFFISSHSLLSLAEEVLCEFTIYLPELSGEKVSPGCQRNPCTKYRASAYSRNGAKHAPLFRVCGCNMQCACFGMTPHAGPPPGQESHLLSLGDAMYKSLQLGNAGDVPPAIPGRAPLQSRRCPLSLRACSKYRARVYCQGL